MATTPLRRWGFGGARLRYLPGHSKGRRREVYAVESRHWAQLQKGPNKEEERKKWRKTKKEEKKNRRRWRRRNLDVERDRGKVK